MRCYPREGDGCARVVAQLDGANVFRKCLSRGELIGTLRFGAPAVAKSGWITVEAESPVPEGAGNLNRMAAARESAASAAAAAHQAAGAAAGSQQIATATVAPMAQAQATTENAGEASDYMSTTSAGSLQSSAPAAGAYQTVYSERPFQTSTEGDKPFNVHTPPPPNAPFSNFLPDLTAATAQF